MAAELVAVFRKFQEINHNKMSHGFMLILSILSQGFSYLTSSRTSICPLFHSKNPGVEGHRE